MCVVFALIHNMRFLHGVWVVCIIFGVVRWFVWMYLIIMYVWSNPCKSGRMRNVCLLCRDPKSWGYCCEPFCERQSNIPLLYAIGTRAVKTRNCFMQPELGVEVCMDSTGNRNLSRMEEWSFQRGGSFQTGFSVRDIVALAFLSRWSEHWERQPMSNQTFKGCNGFVCNHNRFSVETCLT